MAASGGAAYSDAGAGPGWPAPPAPHKGAELPSATGGKAQQVADGAAPAASAAPQERHKKPAFAVALAGCGLASYAVLTWLLMSSSLGVDARSPLHQVDPLTYVLPMMGFITAFVLNSICLLFERESPKFQLAVLACYINFLAGCNDYLSWKRQLPIVVDCWGNPVHIGREVMWMHSTVAMVYLLGIISDFTQQEVYLVMLADVGMILCSITGHLAETRTGSALLFFLSFACFGYVLWGLWLMFASAIKESSNETSRATLAFIQHCTMVLWSLFPVVFLLNWSGRVSWGAVEWMWTITDVLAKVMFSSTLMHSNFLTIEQRRLIVMRIIEEGNRLQVIQELQDLVQQKERFLNGMSHELRTPLNGIIGLSDAALVGSCGEVSEPMHKTLSTIKLSGSRLLSLINDVLDAATARQHKGQLTIKHEKVHLRRVVDDVLELCGPLARSGVKLVNQVPATLPAVLGDTGRIIQVFHNLLGNACKFTHAGSITVSALLKHDEVEVAVSDTGIGMPEDKQQGIFEPFEQVDAKTTRKYGGTGLGLTLVKQLVEAHGGAISVKSKPNVGTAFYFTLKVWDADDVSSVMSAGSTLRHASSRGVAGAILERHQGPGASPKPPRAAALGGSGRFGRGSAMSEGGMPAAGGKGRAAWSSAGSVVSAPGLVARALGARGAPRRSNSNLSQGKGGPPSGSPHSGSLAGGAAAAAGKQELDPVALLAQRAKMGGVQVLSVDDDPVNQMVIQNLLAPAGCTITAAMDGQEALEILEGMGGALPDIILLDVMMPGMSGYEVCRTIRQLYPDSGVPVIMISAKSKEEDIVEGLASGANDYVVKPFGRSEILARITTHLQLHDRTHHSAEGEGRRSDCAASPLLPLLAVPARGGGLPPRMAAGMQTTQLFDQVTVVAWHVTNLAELASHVASEDLAAALTALHIQADQLLDSWGLYCPDDPNQDYCVVVSGLHGRDHPHVMRALDFCRSLLKAAADLPPLPPSPRSAAPPPGAAATAAAPLRLEVACGVHALSAQGVLVGATHPVMHVGGPVLHMAVQLMHASEPGCAHVSHKVHKAAVAADELLAPAGWVGDHRTYVLKAGGAWQDALHVIVGRCSDLTADPSAVLGVHEVRLNPLQRALMMLTRTCPAAMVAMTPAPAPAAAQEGADGAAGKEGEPGKDGEGAKEAGQGGAAAAVDPQQVEQAERDKALLQRQLDDVSEECGRLADEVDTLTAQLKQAQQLLSAAAEQPPRGAGAGASTAAAEEDERQQQQQQARVRELERQLAEATAELAGARASLRDAERKAAAWEQLLQRLGAAGAGELPPAAATATTIAPRAGSQLGSEASDLSLPPAWNIASGWPGGVPLDPKGPVDEEEEELLLLAGGGDGAAGQARAAALAASILAGAGASLPGAAAAAGSSARSSSGILAEPPAVVVPAAARGGAAELAAALSPAARQDVQVLLQELGLQEVAPRFVAEQVTPELLCAMGDAELQELGVHSVGARLKIKLAAQALYGAAAQ